MKESQETEFKLNWRDEYLKHLCAFANSYGGKLHLGVNNDGIVVGVDNSKKLLEDIPNKVIQRLGITIDLRLIEHNEKEVIEIGVKPSNVPISYNGKYYIRSGSTVQELNGHELRRFILQKENISWDEIVVPEAEISEMDEQLLIQFMSKAVDGKRLSAAALKEDISVLLHKLDLLNDKGELTRAAILLFGKRPNKHIRSATVKLGRFGTSDTDLISHDVVEGNILQMPDRIIDLLRTKYLSAPIYYEGIERKERLEYPEKALREALLNAIVHRDYGEQTDITIKVYSNRIVFWNSGPLIAPLNLEMLKQEHPSKRRNPLIANAFFRYGYIEAWGRGILLIMEEAAKAGLPEPVIEEYAGGIQVTFFKSRGKTVGKTVGNTVGKTVGKLYELLKENPQITREELAVITGLSIRGVEYNLNKLKQDGLIKRIGPAKGGYWEITNNQ